MRNLHILKLKKSIVKGIAPLLLMSPMLALGQWSSSSTNASYHLYAMEVVNDDLILTGGYGGSLLKSTDGGASFSNLNTGYNDWVTGISFFDENLGYVSCKAGSTLQQSHLLKTTDGGTTFTVINDSLVYQCMNWLSQDIGLIGCDDGKIIKTTDGGNTWQNIVNPANSLICEIQFFNENDGFVLTLNRKLLKTTDGGQTWTTYSVPYIETMYFLDMQNGFMADYNGNVGKTTDGGATFTLTSTPFNYQMRDIHFLTYDIGFVIGGLDCSNGSCTQKPAILKTIDGGLNWTVQSHPFTGSNEGFFEIDFCPNGKGFISGSNTNVLQTTELLNITENEEVEVEVYPNPTANKLNITTPFNNYEVSIFNTQGSLVASFDCKQKNSIIDVSKLSAGNYSMKISDNQGKTTSSKSFTKVD